MKNWFSTLMALVAALTLPLGLQAQDGPVLSAEITQIAVNAVDYSVAKVTVTNGGSGYSANTKVTISGGGGTGATAEATILAGVITEITVTNPGGNYLTTPVIVISDSGENNNPGGSGAEAFITPGFSISKIEVTGGGANYQSVPTVTLVSAPGDFGTGATAQAYLNADGTVKEVVITNAGGGYLEAPSVVFTGGGGEGAAAQASFGYSVVAIGLTETDNNVYLKAPTVTLIGGNYSIPATAKAVIDSSGTLTGITVVSAGAGYTSSPFVIVNDDGIVSLPGGGTGPGGAGIKASADIGSIFLPPYQNESYGPAESYIVINALAKGTFPAGLYTYTYFINGVSIGKALPVPVLEDARVAWTPPEPGVYYIHVEVDDGLGNTAKSLAVRYFSTGTGIHSPLDNTLVPRGSSVVVQASAVGRPQRPNAFVQRIEFYADGVKVDEDYTYPYSTIYTPPDSDSVFDHTVEARAFDNNGNQVSTNGTAVINLHMVNPEIQPLPVVSILSPANNAGISVERAIADGVEVRINASSSSNKIGKVELYVDGVLTGTTSVYPYVFNWKPAVAGEYKLVALAYDGKNNVVASNANGVAGSVPTPTVVNISTPPGVQIITPKTGDSVTDGDRVTVTARATAIGDGNSISKVAFYVDGVFVGEDTTTDAEGIFSSAFTPVQQIDPDTRQPVPSQIYAIAYDAVGLSGTSSTSSLTVTKGGSDTGGTGNEPIGLPPTISIVAPASGGELQVNAPVEIISAANDPDGKVHSVQFFVDGEQVGEADAIYPYSATWTPTALGTYVITSRVVDNDGNATRSSSVTVAVTDPSSIPPTVTLLQPSANGNAVVGSPLTLLADANDTDGSIENVQFYVNGKPYGAPLISYPFITEWTPLTPGQYTILARAVDNFGTISTSALRVITVTKGTAPVVTLISPSDGSSVNAGVAVRVTASATDSDDAIKEVHLYANNSEIAQLTSAPYSTTWIPKNSGTFVFVAQATDAAGNITTSATRSITVRANQLPTVTLTSPGANKALMAGGSLELKATASDNDGTIVNLEFSVNDEVVASDSTAPYQALWTPASEGVYRVAALATDNAGAIVSSKVVYVKVTSDDINAVDSIYAGTYLGNGKSGKFAFVNSMGRGAVFIGFSDAGAQVYRYTGLPVSGDGSFSKISSGTTVLSGTASPVAVSGFLGSTISDPMFIGQLSSTTGTIPSGLYNGSVVGRPASDINAIISADGVITASVSDGSFVDAGRGTVTKTGSFSVTMVGGSVLSGQLDLNTSFITATLTGSAGGSVLASNTSSLVINDGSLRNLSARALVSSGNDLVAGFVIGGTDAKWVLLRAVGPKLLDYGMPAGSVLPDPKLIVHQIVANDPVLIGQNNDWVASSALVNASVSVGAFSLNSGSKDAAILLLLEPGLYTATVTPNTASSGVALVELYDVDALQPFAGQKIINISARAEVGVGANSLHAGFVVSGDTSKKVFIRAVGPTLGSYGVASPLADPVITLRRLVNNAWQTVRVNDNSAAGNDKALLLDALSSTGSGLTLLTSDTKSSELLVSLPPGTYSAEVTSATGAVGTALVEVYEVP